MKLLLPDILNEFSSFLNRSEPYFDFHDGDLSTIQNLDLFNILCLLNGTNGYFTTDNSVEIFQNLSTPNKLTYFISTIYSSGTRLTNDEAGKMMIIEKLTKCINDLNSDNPNELS